MDVVVILGGQGELLEVVRALDPPGGLADRLNGGQKQGDRTAMMAITTSNSIRVKARRRVREPGDSIMRRPVPIRARGPGSRRPGQPGRS